VRIAYTPGVCSGLLCGLSILIAGCSNPSSQTLDSLTVTATPSSLSVGGAAVLRATAHLSDGTTQDVSSGTQWTLSNSALASMSNGSLTAKATGTLTVQAAYIEVTPAGTSPASATAAPETLSASTQVTIAAAGTSNVPSLTWSTPAPVFYGTALSAAQLNATANVPGTFAYAPAAGTLLSAGTQTLFVTFTPSDTKTYSAATASVQLNVNQASPVVTWATPAAISVGTALGPAQLNATANIPGSFLYNPAAGAVPAAGTQALAVVFTPSDTTDYATATANNTITVGSGSNPSNPSPSPVLPTPSGCGGPTINLNSGMSQSTLQSMIANAPNCSLISFAAGTYNITSQLTIPCNNLQITGPVASTPTAILAASFQNGDLFAYAGGCANLGSINYLHFENTGAVYLGIGNESNLTFQYNLVTHLPSGTTNSSSESGLFFDGTMSSTLSNVLVQFNTFGDANSCATVFATVVDEGGLCAGILTTEGTDQNITIQYNNFVHVEEGIHFNQIANYAVGAQASVCISCTIEYNSISNYHRIGIEIQVDTPTNSILIEHNAIVDPINSSWGTYAVSMACCQWGNTFGTVGFSPAYIFTDNVLVASLPIGSECPPFGVEFWGTGSQGTNSLVEGTFCYGYTWGYGGGSWAINNNYVCGPNYLTGGGGYIVTEENQPDAPTETGNTTGVTCSATASTAPTISPSGGSFSGSQAVTLSDTGTNTGIWYTTDGSTPVPGSGTAQYYTSPFNVTSTTTVKAVGMWGTANQPVSYPAGYGYVPSSAVSASFASGSAVKRPSSQVSSFRNSGETPTESAAEGAVQTTASLQTLSIAPAAPELAIGGTTQLKAVATFSDGSTRDVTSQVSWKSSDMRTILVGSSGTLTGLASGEALLTGSWQDRQTAVLASSTVGEIEWSGPIVITQGGTYSGNWQSTDPKTPAVTIATTDPVILQDAHMRSASDLIQVNVEGADLTVRNSLGVAVNAAVKRQPNGVFLNMAAPARLDVENNYMENVRDGVLVRGYSGSRSEKETLIIRGNRARNLNGLLSDGGVGYLPGEGANRSASRFIELENVQSVPGIDVGWNEVIDYPEQSLVSDVINVYRSSGTPNRPLEVHDTYIQGAYPYKPALDAYQGGGIRTDGAGDDTAQNASAYTYIHDNQVVGTVSYGIAFGEGHDNVAANNRVLSSGLLPDGRKIAAQQVGLRNAQAQGNAAGSMYNNTMHDNLVGWACWTTACGAEFLPASPADYLSNSVVAGKQITWQMEESEYLLWMNKTASAGIKVGPTF
jgi:hypothetical protein